MHLVIHSDKLLFDQTMKLIGEIGIFAAKWKTIIIK